MIKGEMIILSKEMTNPKIYSYKGHTARLNPLTGHWLIDFRDECGAYFTEDKAGVRSLVNKYIKITS